MSMLYSCSSLLAANSKHGVQKNLLQFYSIAPASADEAEPHNKFPAGSLPVCQQQLAWYAHACLGLAGQQLRASLQISLERHIDSKASSIGSLDTSCYWGTGDETGQHSYIWGSGDATAVCQFNAAPQLCCCAPI